MLVVVYKNSGPQQNSTADLTTNAATRAPGRLRGRHAACKEPSRGAAAEPRGSLDSFLR